MTQINRVVIGPQLFGMVHVLLLPRGATISDQMVTAYGTDRVAVFAHVDPQVTEMVPQYLLLFNTGEVLGSPVDGQLQYLRTVVLLRVPTAKIINPKVPQQQVSLLDVHVFRFTPESAEAEAKLRGATSAKTH